MTSVFRNAGGTIVSNETSQTSTVALEAAEARRIDALRARKEERRLRFLDARTRSIGIDVDYIAKQQEEKKERARAEREAELRFAREQAAVDRALEGFEIQMEKERKAKDAQTAAEWKRQQRMAKYAPDYELRDKDALKKQLPARMGDADPRLGPSSMQMFTGEDLKEADRRALQQKQMREWCMEQNTLKRAGKIREYEDELAYRRYLEHIEELRKAADAAAAEAEAARIKANKLENDRLAMEAAEARKRAKEEEEAANAAEIARTVEGGILSEDPADARSALGPHRIRRDHYRGMSAAQVAAYREAQAEQRRRAAERKAAEKAEDIEDARRQRDQLRAAARLEAQQAAQAAKEKAQYAAALAQQRKAFEARAARERKEALEPAFTDGFFGGFGQSDR